MGSVLVVGWREAKPCFPAERNVLGLNVGSLTMIGE